MKRNRLVRILVELVCIASGAATIAPPAMSRGMGMINGETRPRQAAVNVPWSPRTRCVLNPTNDKGIHPAALAALPVLASNRRYQFWRPSAATKEKVQTFYRASNQSRLHP